jgi:hypothetical protein
VTERIPQFYRDLGFEKRSFGLLIRMLTEPQSTQHSPKAQRMQVSESCLIRAHQPNRRQQRSKRRDLALRFSRLPK